MNSSLRRCCVIVFVFLGCMALPVAGSAQNTSPFLSWDELAAHAGLVGINAKTKDQFKADVLFRATRSISVVKAAILLTPNEWAYLNSSIPNHLLHPWSLGKVDIDTWKHTVDLGLPFESTVNVDRLKVDDKFTILRGPDLHTTRLYMLSPNADGKSGVLYYFYVRD
jgi:hypothetical protein